MPRDAAAKGNASSSPNARVRSRVGAMYPGDKVRFGPLELHRDMLDWPWLKAWAFSATGRMLSSQEIQLLDALCIAGVKHVVVHSPTVAQATGSRSCTDILGLSAGLASADAGPDALLHQMLTAQRTLEQPAAQEQAPGRLDRALDNELLDLSMLLGLSDRPHQLALRRLAHQGNANGSSGDVFVQVAAALAADLGFVGTRFAYLTHLFAAPAVVRSQRSGYLGSSPADFTTSNSWLGCWTTAVTGRRLDARRLAVLEAIWVYTGYPDVRLWNNRVAALAVNRAAPTSLGLAAATALCEAWVYGRQVTMQSARFLSRCVQAEPDDEALDQLVNEEIRRFGRLAGFGRPLAPHDERLAPLLAAARAQGFGEGPHLSMATRVQEALTRRGKPLKPTYAALNTALGCDMGFSPEEFTPLIALAFHSGVPACQNEWSAPEGASLLPVQSSDIDYRGPSPRDWKERT